MLILGKTLLRTGLFIFVDFTIMVIGGFNATSSIDPTTTLNNMEEIKLNSSVGNNCPVPDVFPVRISRAMGANMSENC